jgi:CHRD domain-containing protein
MGHVRMKLAAATAAACALGVGGVALAGGGGEDFEGTLTGYEEVPAVSTGASGSFAATVRIHHGKIWWKLHYEGLTGDVQQAHVHFAQRDVNGGVAVNLCSNLEPAPPRTQPCPAPPATITGVARAADVVGPAEQGIAPGEFDELVAAMRAGLTYVNVHSSVFPAGEIRGQLEPAQ